MPMCAYIRKNNFYWVTLPMCSSYLVVFVVTVYVINIIIKQENTIAPLINLHIRAKPSDESSSRKRFFTITLKNNMNRDSESNR